MSLSYSFDDRIEDEEEILRDFTKELRPITWGIIFCPKCGAKNSFKEGAPGIQLNYFCTNCSTRLNDYWKSYENGQRSLINCENCQQLTFDMMIYCIHCGAKQRKIAYKESKQKSEALGPSPLGKPNVDVPITSSSKNSCMSGDFDFCQCIHSCVCCCGESIYWDPCFIGFIVRLLVFPLRKIKQRFLK